MSTISPFVPIEGRISQPRARAAGLLPPPFGDEWALRSPETGLRADLSALLRTFCLHDETIWSMCHWTSAWPGQTSTRVAATNLPGTTPPGQSASAADAWLQTAPAPAPMPGRFATRPGVRAASACAIGGAAILAWVAIVVLSQRHPQSGTAPALRLEAAQGASAPVHAPAPRSAAAQENAPWTVPPLPYSAHPTLHSVRGTERATRHHTHALNGPAIGATRHAGTVRASASGHRHAPSAHPHLRLARPSSAGGYSPFAPSKLGNDDYASITLSAGARLRDAATAPSAAHRVNAGDTEWMSHMSQRRVTEVPEAFSK
jgi:hypothetical protein